MVSWPDGTIWIADGRHAGLWEVHSDGSGPRPSTWLGGGESALEQIHGIVRAGSEGLIVFGRVEVLLGTRTEGIVRRASIPNIWIWSRLGLSNGGFVVSGGVYEGDPGHGHSVHRYDHTGDHMYSWHPVFEHQDWRATRRVSGGAVGHTESGDLLVSDLAPFRITRYPGGNGDNPLLIVEDENVIARSELERATAPDRPNVTYQERWNRSVYVGETVDGHILNVARMYGSRGRPESLWTLVSQNGDVLASSRHDRAYYLWGRTEAGDYLASYDEWAVKLEVSVVAVGARP